MNRRWPRRKTFLALIAASALLTAGVGLAQQTPCVGFCEALSDGGGNRLRSDVIKQEILDEMQKANFDNAPLRLAGYGAKGLSYAVGALSSSADLLGPEGQAAAAVVGAFEAPLSGSAEYVAGLVQENVAKAVVIKIDQNVHDVILPNGQINRQKLASITSGELAFIYSPEFRAEIGNPKLLDSVTDHITAAQLGEVLKDTTTITETLPVMRKKLDLLDDGMTVLKDSMAGLTTQSKQTAARLAEVDGKVDRASTVVDALAMNSLSPDQILALSRAGALSVSLDDEMRLQAVADGQKIQAQLDDASHKLGVVSQGLSQLGMGDAGAFVNATGELFESAGALALAYTTGDVWGGATAAMSLVSQIGGFGKKKNKENEMMKALFDQIKFMRQDMEKYHKEEMAKLERIDGKLDDLQLQMQQSNSRIEIDVAEIRFGVSELLSHDVGLCQSLLDSFNSNVGAMKSRVEFARWFENDGRNNKWQKCMDGLAQSLKVKNESSFASYLLAQPEDVVGGAVSFDDPRGQIRAFQEEALQPSVAYTKKYAQSIRSGSVDLFMPTFSVCTVASVDNASPVCEMEVVSNWQKSRLPRSTLNPGNGQFVSDERALALARFSRTIAAWNTALVERPSSAVPTVISDSEFRQFTANYMGRRTRHLEAMRAAVDALDVVIAQSELVSGAPIIDFAVDQLEKNILPAYARLRLLGDEKPLLELLQRGASAPFPIRLPKCSTGAPAFDTLCLMQTNRWFAENVIRALMVRRLSAKNVDAIAWNSAARIPASVEASKLLGPDVLLVDASIRQTGSPFSAWAIQLPRVEIKPIPSVADQTGGASSCWDKGAVPKFEKPEDFKVFYAKGANARCYMLPLVSQGGLDRMQFPSDLSAVAVERKAVLMEVESLCRSLPTYPDAICGEFRNPIVKANRHGQTAGRTLH